MSGRRMEINMIKRIVGACVLALMAAGTAQATTTNGGITEGARDQVDGTSTVGGDATNNPDGFDLGTLLPGSFGIYGRIVSQRDFFQFDFATDNDFTITFDELGYFVGGNEVLAADSGLIGVSGSNQPNDNGKIVGFSLISLDGGTDFSPVLFNADQTGGDIFGTLISAGRYSLLVDGTIAQPDAPANNPSKVALYDLNINVVPVPFGAALLASAIFGLGVRSRLRRKA